MLHVPRRSVHQCVLDKRNCHIGDPVPGPLTPARCAVFTRMGVLSGPFHNKLFPQGLQGPGFSGVPGGAPKASLAPHPPHPPCRACVGVAVMASVDIL